MVIVWLIFYKFHFLNKCMTKEFVYVFRFHCFSTVLLHIFLILAYQHNISNSNGLPICFGRSCGLHWKNQFKLSNNEETMLNVPEVILRLNFKIIKLFSELYAYEIKFIKLKILINKRGLSRTDRWYMHVVLSYLSCTSNTYIVHKECLMSSSIVDPDTTSNIVDKRWYIYIVTLCFLFISLHKHTLCFLKSMLSILDLHILQWIVLHDMMIYM